MTSKDAFEQLRLENQLCFALYAATRAVTKAYRQNLDPIGLTYPQYLVLTVLWENDGATLTEIGTTLMLDSGTLTPIVQRMERAGYVVRKQRKSDERAREVWLTPEGLNFREFVVGARDKLLCKVALSDCDMKRLRADLIGLIERVNAGEDAKVCEELV